MMMKYAKVLVVAAVACLLFPARIPAQNSAQSLWQGVLRDAAGMPISGAVVRLKGKPGTFNASTSADGQFRIERAPAGTYRLSVDAKHDKLQYALPVTVAASASSVVVTLSSEKTLSVTSVTVERAATGGEALSSQAVSELPLNKRDFSQLLLLAAGTMTDTNGATNFTQQFAINGQRGVEAVFAMDGADISDPEMGGSTFSNFNVDAVAGDPIQLRLDARRDRPRRRRLHQHHHPLRQQRLPRVILRICPQLRLRRPQLLRPRHRRNIPAASRPSAETSSASPTAARVLPHLYNGRGKTFYFGQYQGFRQVLGTTQVFPVPTAQERNGFDPPPIPATS